MANYTDQTLTCVDCGNQFTFTASEQEFYASRGLTNAPKRCKECRAKKKAEFGNNGGSRGGYGARDGGMKQSFPIVCSNCGKESTVPFKPTGDRPVLCRDCFNAQKSA